MGAGSESFRPFSLFVDERKRHSFLIKMSQRIEARFGTFEEASNAVGIHRSVPSSLVGNSFSGKAARPFAPSSITPGMENTSASSQPMT